VMIVQFNRIKNERGLDRRSSRRKRIKKRKQNYQEKILFRKGCRNTSKQPRGNSRGSLHRIERPRGTRSRWKPNRGVGSILTKRERRNWTDRKKLLWKDNLKKPRKNKEGTRGRCEQGKSLTKTRDTGPSQQFQER